MEAIEKRLEYEDCKMNKTFSTSRNGFISSISLCKDSIERLIIKLS